MSKLKPCPMCGTEPYTKIEPRNSNIIDLQIICNNPQCGTALKRNIKDEYWFTFERMLSAIDEMAEKWNRRTVLNE